MPNWCNNNLKITGPEDELYKFKGRLHITKDDDVPSFPELSGEPEVSDA